MAIFPLKIYPEKGYHHGGVAFGASSKNRGDRMHAACDMIVPPGTPVYAVERGVVLEVPKTEFFQHTFTVVIRHANFTIRYGELDKARLVSVGDEVEEGQQIGVVGRNNKGRGMLHFEMYRGTVTGSLSKKTSPEYLFVPQKNYLRRKDLLDPTPFLDRWMAETPLSTSWMPEPEQNSSEW